MTHRYRGLLGDGELYAVQALAKIVPSLGVDVFLRGTSQDRYTFFSPFYAMFIEWFGVRTAAISLTILFKVWFYCAGWALLRAFVNNRRAFLGVALLIVLSGAYGAYSVFSYCEDFLTARLAAEALVVSAVALHFHGKMFLSAVAAAIALFIHPLMALPGVLLLLCISAPLRWRVPSAAATTLAALGVAYYGKTSGASNGMFAILDPAWLEVVRERSQFLFLQLWSTSDWFANGRPLISLLITIFSSGDVRIRRFGWACILVGVSGVLIAFVAGTIGPVAILIQGQAWRWLWIPAYASAALLVPTLINLRRDEKCGILCALLLILGWTVPPLHNFACLVPALLLWLVRSRLRTAAASYLRWFSVGLAILVGLWTLKTAWDVFGTQLPESGLVISVLARSRKVLGFQASAALVGWLIYQWVGRSRSLLAMFVCSTTFTATAAVSLPGALVQTSNEGALREIDEFQDWRAVIPPQSNVYVVPARHSAAFAWFTLQRPNYLSLDQSSGVVFSRETALEVKRRSQLLLAIAPEDWKLLTAMEERRRGVPKKAVFNGPITRENLIAVCVDSQLGFVVAQPNVGFEPIKHLIEGGWKDWNLYDCARVRASATGT